MTRALVALLLIGVAHADATDELQRAVLLDYAHRDEHAVDWKTRFATYAPRLRTASDAAAFASIANELLTAAQDPHISITVGEQTLVPTPPRLRRNIDLALISPLIPNYRSDQRCVGAGNVGDVGYVLIGHWDDKCADVAERAITNSRTLRALIVDVRTNSGGDELAARRVAGHFATKETAYSTVEIIDHGRVRSPETHRFAPRAPQFAGRVIVLMGNACMSSNEEFLLMMRAAGTTLIGEPSRGSSGNPLPHKLANGVVVNLPSWRERDLKGAPIEGHGITPDLRVNWPPIPAEDVVLKAALQAALQH